MVTAKMQEMVTIGIRGTSSLIKQKLISCIYCIFFSKLVHQSNSVAQGIHDGGIGGHALERGIAEERAD
jgi:hypothetical protein